jgi:signal transduction histidine kinase
VPGRSRWRWAVTDPVVLPLLCLADLLAGSTVLTHDAGRAPQFQLLAAALGFVPLLWRHRAPLLVFAVTCAQAAAVWFLVPEYRPTSALIVALYAVAVDCPRRWSLAALAVAVARSGLSGIDSMRIEPDPRARSYEFMITMLLFAVFYATAWAAGTLVRSHRGRLDALEAERTRARDEALAAERRRIAAELHDVVSHSVTLMVLQAAGAARFTGTDPERVHQALLHIQQAGQQAMAELRRLLDVLQLSGRSAPVATDPMPGLRDLPALIETVCRAGLRIELSETGLPLPLDPSVELTAYRVVQECLTNTLKHAGPGTAIRIRLTWTDPVILEVDDDGTGWPATDGPVTGWAAADGPTASGPAPGSSSAGRPVGSGPAAGSSSAGRPLGSGPAAGSAAAGRPVGSGPAAGSAAAGRPVASTPVPGWPMTGGPVASGLSTGHGLASLAERVRTVGGVLTSGPGPQGGFHVTAVLPPSSTGPAPA